MNKLELHKLKEEVIKLTAEFRLQVESGNKDYIRDLHLQAKRCLSEKKLKSLREEYSKKYKKYFIQPSELQITNIKPILINVDVDPLWSSIFSLVRYTWSMPFSKGYGRRLRYIVFDDYHGSVIGIIGFQSPPADLACRDKIFTYPEGKKLELINQTMDIYTLGSVPPYSGLLGGKLVAGLAASSTVQDDYYDKYSGKETVMGKSKLDSRLVALTTTSAYGRSSIYNRLKFEQYLIAKSIGYTSGSGNIHLESVYPKIVELLKEKNLYHGGGYGNGPKPRWQNLARAFSLLGLPAKQISHGLKREVFLYSLVNNLNQGMAGGDFGNNVSLNSHEYADFWKKRWALPRSQRNVNWKSIDTNEYILTSLR